VDAPDYRLPFRFSKHPDKANGEPILLPSRIIVSSGS